MVALALALLIQGAAPPDSAARRPLAVQLGVTIAPESVTVGQRFVVIIKVRAPRGATIEFPEGGDSAASSTGTQVLGKPVVEPLRDSTAVTVTAAYRLAAWDVGPQPLGLRDIVVKSGAQTGYVSLADRAVFVRSVLPEDSALRVPKPPRPPIEIAPFNWVPWALLALAVALGALLWRLFIWYRRRRNAPLAPFAAAEREFNRIEALRLPESGEGARHVALMADVMRDYLAARVDGISRSQTSSELLAAAGAIHPAARGIGELLWRADMAKFAGVQVDAGEAGRLGAAARSIVNSVEDFLVRSEASESDREVAA